jgi:hypothetical protein
VGELIRKEERIMSQEILTDLDSEIEKLMRIAEQAEPTALKGYGVTPALHTAVMALIEAECIEAFENERRENIGDKYDRLKALAEKVGYEKAFKDVAKRERRTKLQELLKK